MMSSALVALRKAVVSDLSATSWSIFVYFNIALAGSLLITAAELLTKVSAPPDNTLNRIANPAYGSAADF